MAPLSIPHISFSNLTPRSPSLSSVSSIKSSTTNLITRTVSTASHSLLTTRQQSTPEEDRNEISFFEKHKPLVIGMLVALPLQILFALWYIRRRKARKAILASCLAEIQENRERMKMMNLEHAKHNRYTGGSGSMAGSSASSSASNNYNTNYNTSNIGAGIGGGGGGYRGESLRMQNFRATLQTPSTMLPPPPVYDGRRAQAANVQAMEAFSGGKI